MHVLVNMLTRSKVRYIIFGAITITSMVVFARVVIPAVFYLPNADVGTVSASSEKKEIASTSTDSILKKIVTKVFAAAESDPVPDNYPVFLIIPSISTRAHVQYVGVTSKGTMAVPNNFTDVAWYKDGVVPGDTGTAVIDGHLDDGLGLPAVFWSLSKLNLGDEIDVVTKDNKKIVFVVTKVNLYHTDDPNAGLEIFSQSNKPTIRLITCDGVWLKDQKTYNERLVVSAELV